MKDDRSFTMMPNVLLESDAWARAGGTTRAVVLAIAKHVNVETGEAFPGYRRIAAYARCEPRTVERAIREAMELGLIKRTKKGVGRTHKSHYRLVVDGHSTDDLDRRLGRKEEGAGGGDQNQNGRKNPAHKKGISRAGISGEKHAHGDKKTPRPTQENPAPCARNTRASVRQEHTKEQTMNRQADAACLAELLDQAGIGEPTRGELIEAVPAAGVTTDEVATLVKRAVDRGMGAGAIVEDLRVIVRKQMTVSAATKREKEAAEARREHQAAADADRWANDAVVQWFAGMDETEQDEAIAAMLQDCPGLALRTEDVRRERDIMALIAEQGVYAALNRVRRKWTKCGAEVTA